MYIVAHYIAETASINNGYQLKDQIIYLKMEENHYIDTVVTLKLPESSTIF